MNMLMISFYLIIPIPIQVQLNNCLIEMVKIFILNLY